MDKLIAKHKKNILCFLALLGFSLFTYSVLMVNQLVNNYDGMWEGNFHIADNWELSIGRWFWYYLSKLRFGIAMDPVVSIISLSIFVLGIILAANLLEVRDSLPVIAVGAAFMCTPLVCIDLSYRFMSPTFATAFLLAILAVYVSIRVRRMWLAILTGSLLMAMSLGSYQAYIGVSCVITLAYFIKLLMTDDTASDCLKKLIRPILTIILGGILYIILLKIHLTVKNVEMSDYMGASSYSVFTVIKNFPRAFCDTYKLFHYSLNGALFSASKLTKFKFEAVVLIAFIAVFLFYLVKRNRKNIPKIVCGLIALLLLPPAAYSVFFITREAPVSLQMTAGYFMIVPAVLMALPLSFEKEKLTRAFSWGLSVIVMISAYGGFYQVQTDQNAMYEGTVSTMSITEAALERVDSLGYLDTDYKYCILGIPAGSQLYHLDGAAYNFNQYAVVGVWWGGYNGEKSWRGIVNNRMELNLTFVDEAAYNAICSSEEAKSMPAFPQEGSVRLMGDTVVIKISEY